MGLNIYRSFIKKASANKNKTIEIYQDVMTNLINNSKKLKLLLSIDIPFWFNEITYSSKYGSGNLAEWLFKNMENQLRIVNTSYSTNTAFDGFAIEYFK